MRTKKIFSVLLSMIFIFSYAALPVSANADESGNPVLNGYYGDPDIDWFDCKFWIYPTTDGIIDYDDPDGWWGAKTFKAFSSEDMVNWKDNGVILDVGADTAEEAGINEYGVQIAYSPWSSSHAWAPSIEKVGNKYYFYYVAEIKEEEEYLEKYAIKDENGNYGDIKAIGVAYSDSPTGPFTALDEPIITPKMVYEKFGDEARIPNIIDPSIFIDTDSTPYMTFGNGVACIVKLNSDMISIDKSTISALENVPISDTWEGDTTWDETGRVGWMVIDGIPTKTKPSYGKYADFMEAVVIFYQNGTYYFTWSVDGTGSENYRVAYSTSKKLTYGGQYQGELLQKDKSKNILGTGHHSILCYKGDAYICYHRLCLDNNGEILEPAGQYREVCIDKINFESQNLLTCSPTHEGTGPVSSHSFAYSYTINPTTSAPGAKVFVCPDCKQSYSEAIAQLPPEETKSTEPATSVTTTTQASANTKTTVKKPAVPKSLSLKSAKKSMKISFNKVSGASGYQVQYALNSKFTSGKKTVTLKGAKKTSTTIKKLKSKKKYYIRVRAYKTSNGKTVYSSWSTTKSVKVK